MSVTPEPIAALVPHSSLCLFLKIRFMCAFTLSMLICAHVALPTGGSGHLQVTPVLDIAWNCTGAVIEFTLTVRPPPLFNPSYSLI